ncbi:MAG: HlyD family type I secretion periplasmic adaptor subunit [Hyphomicrobiaceae bacterium]
MLKQAFCLAIPRDQWHRTDPWVRLGMNGAVWMVGGLLAFAAIVSISGAVVANGSVTVDGNYKTVQHLDGGIVTKILVSNGMLVQKGAVLMRLDDTGTAANLAIVNGRIRDQLIQQARLIAERDRKPDFDIPATVQDYMSDSQTGESLRTQRALFAARRASHQGELSVLTQRLDQLRSALAGQRTELTSRTRQLELANKDLATVEPLFARGYANQYRLGQLQREQARMQGEVGRAKADIESTKGAISEAELKIAQAEKSYTQTVVDDLQKVQAQLSELDEQRKTLAGKQDRTIIRAPMTGHVHALAAHTEGGVIQPGTAIMQIIPVGERLVVEAEVQPQDIDKVRQGHAASVRFPAFDARVTPQLEGKVVSVSPAEITDSRGRTYFTARIELGESQIKLLGDRHKLVPGMPAEVFIQTASHSILSYIVKPLVDAMTRSFRE